VVGWHRLKPGLIYILNYRVFYLHTIYTVQQVSIQYSLLPLAMP